VTLKGRIATGMGDISHGAVSASYGSFKSYVLEAEHKGEQTEKIAIRTVTYLTTVTSFCYRKTNVSCVSIVSAKHISGRYYDVVFMAAVCCLSVNSQE
jgi:hypothetical protein